MKQFKYYIIIKTPSKDGWRIINTDNDLDTAAGIIKLTDELSKSENDNVMLVSWKLLNE